MSHIADHILDIVCMFWKMREHQVNINIMSHNFFELKHIKMRTHRGWIRRHFHEILFCIRKIKTLQILREDQVKEQIISDVIEFGNHVSDHLNITIFRQVL